VRTSLGWLGYKKLTLGWVRERKSPEATSQFKQIGFPPFNIGRKILPMKSGGQTQAA
jgi:hypothetical protein